MINWLKKLFSRRQPDPPRRLVGLQPVTVTSVTLNPATGIAKARLALARPADIVLVQDWLELTDWGARWGMIYRGAHTHLVYLQTRTSDPYVIEQDLTDLEAYGRKRAGGVR